MKVLDSDRDQGRIKFRIDSVDDLWHLSHLIEAGDVCSAVTQRRQQVQDDMVRDKAGERVTLVLPVEVEQVEFDEFVTRLRVLGTVVEGPEYATGHHTLVIEPNDWIEVVKPDGWPRHMLDRVNEAVDAGEEPRVVVVSLDEQEATVALILPFGVREVATIESHRSGKGYDQNQAKDTFFQDIELALRESVPQDVPVLVVGPGFTRENLGEWLRNESELELAVATEPTGQAGIVGVREAIKRGAVGRVNERVRVARETQAVERVMARLATGEPVTYGRDHVRRALNLGAVELLLITDELVRDDQGRELLDLAHQTGADEMVIGMGHDAGKQLDRIGDGVAALLRFDLPEE